MFIGQYCVRFDSSIGAGAGCERVVRGYDVRTFEEVAVKIMPKRLTKEHLYMEELKDVAGVIPLLDAYEDDSKYYLVMKYVPKTLLQHVVERNTQGNGVSENEARRIFRQLVSTLGKMHDRKIAHRDIKLENVLFDEKTGNTHLIDYGLARRIQHEDDELRAENDEDEDATESFNEHLLSSLRRRKTKRLNFVTSDGSPGYMAPEVLVRPPEGVDLEKADVYSLGVLLYLLVCAEFPFHDKHNPSYYDNRDLKEQDSSEVDSEFAAFVASMEALSHSEKRPFFKRDGSGCWTTKPLPIRPSSGLANSSSTSPTNSPVSSIQSWSQSEASMKSSFSESDESSYDLAALQKSPHIRGEDREIPQAVHNNNNHKESELWTPCSSPPPMSFGRKAHQQEITKTNSFGPGKDLNCWLQPIQITPSRLFTRPRRKSLTFDSSNSKKVSLELRDLLHSMLLLDDQKRMSMDDVRRHPWFDL